MEIIRLRKTGLGWEFESESALEDFVWVNLQQLLDLTPLKRQYRVKEQICDIIAVDENKRLVVLELKNTEDRYIVQQLTRYYDVLLEENPFQEQIDYEQPVQLIAIAPSFHKDNLTDKKYHNLRFIFLQFQLIQSDGNFYLNLYDLEIEKDTKIKIDCLTNNESQEIPLPPKKLISFLVNSNKYNDTEGEKVLKIRHKILNFDSRMQEITGSGSVIYGKGKNKLCAEIKFDKERNFPVLFLWLPYVSSTSLQKKIFTARMRIWTDWHLVSDIGHVPKGLGRMVSKKDWLLGNARPLNKLLPSSIYQRQSYINSESYRQEYIKNYVEKTSYKSGLALNFKRYAKLIGIEEEFNSLDTVIDTALETWLKRL